MTKPRIIVTCASGKTGGVVGTLTGERIFLNLGAHDGGSDRDASLRPIFRASGSPRRQRSEIINTRSMGWPAQSSNSSTLSISRETHCMFSITALPLDSAWRWLVRSA